MKEQYLNFTTEFLVEQMNHWMLFPAVTAVSFFAGADRPDILLWALTGLFPVLFFLIRGRLQKLRFLLAAHFAAVAPAFFIPADVAGRLLCVLCAFGYLIYSLSLRLKRKELYTLPCHPFLAVAVTAVSFLLHRYQGRIDGWEHYYIIALIGFFFLYSIVQYLQHFADFLTLNRSTAGYLPAEDMLRSGLGLVLGYAFFGVLVMALSINITWLDGLVQALKQGLLSLLRAFFTFLAQSGEPGEFIPEGTSSAQEPFLLPEAEETFWLWRVLEFLFTAALVCVFFYLVIKALIRFIRFLRRFFLGGLLRRETEANTEAATDVREKCTPSKQKRRAGGGLSFSLRDPAFRVRRLYKKTVLSDALPGDKSDSRLFSRLTAREWEGRLHLDGMAEIYEKARYSGKKTTAEDVRRMKAVCSGKSSYHARE
ncbi:MAG: hypothetical protein NC541_07145 [bacterium]|nr:hypothetical protein [bacterium]